MSLEDTKQGLKQLQMYIVDVQNKAKQLIGELEQKKASALTKVRQDAQSLQGKVSEDWSLLIGVVLVMGPLVRVS